ncbi:HNH endonuclease [Nocardia sp. NPDC005366]|uniref:HNH endonuclease n=1 Tax=Nocardia sp. NPDC005366 TaxID=3156878 RepID=UPI0033A005F4
MFNKDLEYEIEEDTQCHLFIGAKNKAGYGVVRLGNSTTLAHRYQWQKRRGVIEQPGIEVCHTHSGNRHCVNVDHLKLGTHAQNMADIKEHSRVYCDAGLHQLDAINSFVWNNKRICKACRAGGGG